MIDFHTHCPAWDHASWLAGKAFDAGQFLAYMDRNGISRAVVLSHDGLYQPRPAANDALAAFVGTAPDRLVGFGAVDARDSGAVAEVHRMMTDLGLRGLKLHPWLHGVSVAEPVVDAVCAAVAENGGIVLCHDGTPPYSTAGQIAALAARHPGLPVVLGHGGLHDCWREAMAAVLATPNLYLCLCGTPPYAARTILERLPAGRVLFGTDAGLSERPSQDYATARVAEIDGWGISDRARRAMLQDAPAALLGVSA